MQLKKFSKKLFLFTLIIFLTACARVPIQQAVLPVEPEVPALIPVERRDLIHEIGPGETIWRIAKMYDVCEQTVIRKNRISNPERIEKGQKILIPQAAPIRPIINLYKSDKWRYIIIHHSGTDEGSALLFDRHHNRRGFSQGLGYHFVIDNGTRGKFDGQIEVSPRWLNQLDGAHCQASNMNTKGIGICLVGNFNHSRPTEKQMEALVYLVNRLRRYYRIPKSNILGHGQVAGARTDCPGKNFSWPRFWQLLRRPD